MVNDFFSLYTAGILAFFLIAMALLVNRYFSKFSVSGEEAVLDILMKRKSIRRDELRKITGLTEEKLDMIFNSIEEIEVDGDEIRYRGARKEHE